LCLPPFRLSILGPSIEWKFCLHFPFIFKQTNGICERFRQTVLNEFYRVTFRKKLYSDLESLQKDLDEFIQEYNIERTHQGKRCQGKTPMETFIEGKKIYSEKKLDDRMAAKL
jgi:hypothetical protein